MSIFGLSSLLSCQNPEPKPQKLDHGWSTPRVIATIYPSSQWSIGFSFPKDPLNCDREEIVDLFNDFYGSIYQMGGRPWAEIIAKFDGVVDQSTADAKLLKMLPALDHLMTEMSLGKPIPKSRITLDREAKRPKWPNTTPPDKSDPHWEFNNNLTHNGTPYKKAEVSPGKWQWVVNEKLVRAEQEYEARKSSLAFAIRSRILTDEETAQVCQLGINLYVQNMVSYNPKDLEKRLNEDLLQQFKLRLAASKASKEDLK